MGLRFRRTLTLLPGVRVNLGLHGASLSVGPRGASLTMGPQGTYANVGLPGTGLSYRTRLSGPNRRAPSAPSPSRRLASPPARAPNPLPEPADLTLQIHADGTSQILFTDGRVPGTNQANAIWDAYASTLRQALSDEADHRNALIEAVTDVHLDTPGCDCVPVYVPRPFAAEPPQVPVEPVLESAPKVPDKPLLGLLERFSESARRKHAQTLVQWRHACAEANLQWQTRRDAACEAHARAMRQHRAAMDAWDRARVRHDSNEQDKADVFPARIRTDIDTMHACLSDTLMSLQWPRETVLSYEIDVPTRMLMIDVDLPEIEDMPGRITRLSENGRRLVVKELSERSLRQAYARHVHGILMRVCGVAFASLPSMRTCVVSGFSQRRDPQSGVRREEYLLSAQVDRDGFSILDFEHLDRVDPVEVLERFSLRRRMTKTGIFRPVEPFQPSEASPA